MTDFTQRLGEIHGDLVILVEHGRLHESEPDQWCARLREIELALVKLLASSHGAFDERRTAAFALLGVIRFGELKRKIQGK